MIVQQVFTADSQTEGFSLSKKLITYSSKKWIKLSINSEKSNFARVSKAKTIYLSQVSNDFKSSLRISFLWCQILRTESTSKNSTLWAKDLWFNTLSFG